MTHSGLIGRVFTDFFHREYTTGKEILNALGANAGIAKQASTGKKKKQTKPTPNPGNGNGSSTPPTPPVNKDASKMKFNLPPHLWSMPINQTTLNINYGTGTGNSVANKTRRGIMWCYTSASSASTKASSTTSNGSGASTSTKLTTVTQDFDWGFQFLWNPTDITTVLNRNVNFTPNTTDATANDANVFTAMETISFKIIIDRVNDFACAKGALDYEYPGPGSTPTETTYANIIATYYTPNMYPSKPKNDVTPDKKLDALLRLGTLADIEYIYKMINGDSLVNPLGRTTSDIGLLSPTAVAVQFGPNPDSLSFVGYVDSLSIDHQYFTEDMIPLHSEITVGFVAYSRYTLKSK